MNSGFKKEIKSYVIRSRMTSKQRLGHEQFWSVYGIERPQKTLNFAELYEREAPIILEIGFGMGNSLIELAQKNPELNFLGIEVHRPGVGAVLSAVNERNLSNIKVACDDAKEWLTKFIPDESLFAVLLLFPDPWPKRRHHKRRIVQLPFVDLIHKKLITGGYFHLVTDVETYATHMQQVIAKHQGLTILNSPGISENLVRPKTKFEQRGERLGHAITDLIYVKS